MADSPVTVIARLKAKPGAQARVRQELMGLLTPTRSEKGCINYDLHQSQADDSLFMFHENWASQEDLDRHLQAPHLKRWRQLAAELLAEPLDLTLWRRVG